MSTSPPIRQVSMARAVVVTCCAIFLITLDVTIVNVSLPAIGRTFDANTSELQWVVDAYTLVFASLMLSSGSLTDRLGSRRVFAAGLTIFLIGSILCGLSPTVIALLVSRAIQGVGAAAALPASLSLLRECVEDPQERARAIALWAAGGTISLAAGPILSGVLTSSLGWQTIFFVNIPFALLGLWGLRSLPRSTGHYAKFDVSGQILAVIALASLTFAIIEVGETGVSSPQVLTGIAVFVVSAFWFLYVERRKETVVVPVDLASDRIFLGCLGVGTILNITNFGILFILALYFQDVRHTSALTAGMLFVPMMVTIGLGNLNVGRVTKRFGTRATIVAGLFIEAIGFAMFIATSSTEPLWVPVLSTIPVAIGVGIAAPPMMATLVGGVPPERVGLASGALNSSRQMGSVMGVAIFGLLITTAGGVVNAIRFASVMSVILLVVMAILAIPMLRPTEKQNEPLMQRAEEPAQS
ncbi:MFS transporter [Streptomyces sp. NPDC001793]|uniref:MFS transporter n=1 Tax=Streptomyces sp. NPDC001793 TaxID=3154657 RepID=UPI00332EA8C9